MRGNYMLEQLTYYIKYIFFCQPFTEFKQNFFISLKLSLGGNKSKYFGLIVKKLQTD